MSIKSPIKSQSKIQMKEPSKLLGIPDHLTDLKILQSRKTYGRNKDYRSLSVSSESSGSFSVTPSEDFKNDILSFSDYNEELYSETNFDFVANVTNNHIENRNNQKEINSEFCLYSEEDFDYIFCEKEDDPSPAIPEKSNSGSNYQRTRKNLKNQLSNQQYDSEEFYDSTSYENNINFLTNTNKPKSPCNNLNSKQNPPLDKQVKITKLNGIKANNMPQKSNRILAKESGKPSGKAAVFQNPLINGNTLSIVDLVNRFAASRNQTNVKNNPSNKRKRSKEECESIHAKKTSTVTKCKKISTPTVSVKKNCKNAGIKSDTMDNINSVSLPQIKNFKTPSKHPQKRNSKCLDAEESRDLKSSVNDINTLTKNDTEAPPPPKVAKKKNFKSDDNMKRSEDMVSNLSVFKQVDTKTPSKKTVCKKDSRPIDDTERTIEMLKKFISKNTPVKKHTASKVKRVSKSAGLNLVRNVTVEKMQVENSGKQVEHSSLVQSEKYSFQNQAFNDNRNIHSNYPLYMPLIIAPMPPTSQDGAFQTVPLGIWRTLPAITTNQSIQSDCDDPSRENFKDASISASSISSYDHSSSKDSPSNVKYLDMSNDIYLFKSNTSTTTTITNQSEIESNKRVFRPRTLINDGIELQRFVTDNLKNIEDNCILHCGEQSNQIFLMNPALQNITVKDFCNNPVVTDVLLDYLTGFQMSKSQIILNNNMGYDFPENFETENLLRVVKDFVHTAISHIIPLDKPMPLNVSYARIMKSAMQKMSSREFIILTQVFNKTEQLFKFKDVLARLGLVALFVIFDEYKKK